MAPVDLSSLSALGAAAASFPVPGGTGGLLTAVARLVGDGATLEELVPRLVALLRPAIPFERLHILRLDRADSIVRYSASVTGELEVVGHRINTAPASPGADASEAAVIVCSMRQGQRVHGALWLTSSVASAFTPEHRVLTELVADLVALAVHQEALRSTEAVRRERIESLDRLLQTMAESLDIRMVFTEVSAVVRGGLPHDVLALTSWAEDGRSFRVYAMAGATVPDQDFWEPIGLSESESSLLHGNSYILRDVGAELDPGSVRGRLLRRVGARSALRVPLPLGGDVFGSLFFISRETDRFDEEDVDFARRVADHLALALSHQRLAVVARRDAEARERAARLEAQVETLTRELEARTGLRRVIGSSRQWKDVLAQAARVARTETTVLLTGESGTGKEVIARFIHHGSKRSNGPFIAINCAALPDQLLESELFGHERGAFTGAQTMRRGRFEQAEGGTLFLDEIGDMPFDLQTRLLRVLSDGHFYRVGGHNAVKANVRVIAATHQDLEQRVKEGVFREDLFHRLNVIRLRLPALRERREDIPMLARHFLQQSAKQLGVEPKRISDAALERLMTFGFPGNVRQLENICHWLTVMAPAQLVEPKDLPPEVGSGAGEPVQRTAAAPAEAVPAVASTIESELLAVTPVAPPAPAPAGGWEAALEAEAMQLLASGNHDVWEQLTRRFESKLILTALQNTRGRRIEAAQKLGIGRNTITRKIQELGLE